MTRGNDNIYSQSIDSIFFFYFFQKLYIQIKKYEHVTDPTWTIDM